MIKQNLHTHSKYCDGKNTIEEMVLAGISRGFETLGFSSHSYTGFVSNSTQICKEDIDSYFGEIDRMKDKYRGKIKLLSGMEYESTCLEGTPQIDSRCDYSIGSVHILHKDSEIYDIDCSADLFNSGCEAFGGVRNYIEAYYSEVVRFAQVSPYTITGHFDLVTKFIGFGVEDFTKQKWYRGLAIDALKQVVSCGKIIELNTGAMARLGKTQPYPEVALIDNLADMKATVVVSSDAHRADAIDFRFTDMEDLLNSKGFEKKYLSSGLFSEVFLHS